MSMEKPIQFSDLIGKTLTHCDGVKHGDRVEFKTADGKSYALYHSQDCCESVLIEDICGDLSDLIGAPILQAEENSSNEDPPGVQIDDGYRDSFTWKRIREKIRKI